MGLQFNSVEEKLPIKGAVSKECTVGQTWDGIFGFALLLAPFFARSLTLVPRSLLLNRTETLATQTKRAETNGWRL